MTRSEARQKREAAGRLHAQASRLEQRARGIPVSDGASLRLRGRALVLRGSAWVLDADAMEADG